MDKISQNPYEDKYAQLTGKREYASLASLTPTDVFKGGYAQNKAIEVMLAQAEKNMRGELSPKTREKIIEEIIPLFLDAIKKEKLFDFQNKQPAEEKGAALQRIINDCFPLIRKIQDELGAIHISEQETKYGELQPRSFIEVVSNGLGVEKAVERALRDLEELEYITLDGEKRQTAEGELTRRMSHLFEDPEANRNLPRSEKEALAAELAKITHAVAELYQDEVQHYESQPLAHADTEDDLDTTLDDAFAAFEGPAPAAPKPEPVTKIQPRPTSHTEVKEAPNESNMAA